LDKHVCPVCEDVHAIAGQVDMATSDRAETAEAWGCPRCGYRFVSVDDVARLLIIAAGCPPAPVSLSSTLASEPTVVSSAGVAAPTVSTA
jgi:hypothetical protein